MFDPQAKYFDVQFDPQWWLRFLQVSVRSQLVLHSVLFQLHILISHCLILISLRIWGWLNRCEEREDNLRGDWVDCNGDVASEGSLATVPPWYDGASENESSATGCKPQSLLWAESLDASTLNNKFYIDYCSSEESRELRELSQGAVNTLNAALNATFLCSFWHRVGQIVLKIGKKLHFWLSKTVWIRFGCICLGYDVLGWVATGRVWVRLGRVWVRWGRV